MSTCIKCGHPLNDRTLTCPQCGASQTLDARISGVIMKSLGVMCGVVGVGLLVFGDSLNSPRYMIWIWAGLFILIGFVMFYRKWKE